MNEYRFYQIVKLIINGWHCKNKKVKSNFFPSEEPIWFHKDHPKCVTLDEAWELLE
jgi:hypothetical protein